MTMMSKLVAAGFASLATLLAVLPAFAQSVPTAGHGSVGALFGYGFKDGVKLGMGMRAGYTLPANIYLGGTFVYHLGKSESTTLGNVSGNVYYFGVEGGYSCRRRKMTVRRSSTSFATVFPRVRRANMAQFRRHNTTSASLRRVAKVCDYSWS